MIFDNFNNPYLFIKTHDRKLAKNFNYANNLLRFICMMFEYEKSKIYSKIDDFTIEKILTLNGTCGFWKNNNEVVCGISCEGGMLDTNGVGTAITGTLLNGKGRKGINGIDCVLGKNNSTRTIDTDIMLFADKFTETDISEDCLLRNTRKSQVFTVKNNKIKKALDEILKNIFNGKSHTITDDTLSLSDKKSIDIIDLTDTSDTVKLQNLSAYHNELLRRFYTRYGQALSDGFKMSQQSIEEITNNLSSSFIEPLDRLRCRQQMCKELENVFGGSIKVRFSEPWRIEFEKWTKLQGNVLDNDFDNDIKGGFDNDTV